MNPQYVPAIISGLVSLIVALGTWHVSTKNAREADKKAMSDIIQQNRELTTKEFRDLQESITGVNANVQQQIAIIDLKLDELSRRVEKHNQVVERTYKLEQDTEVQKEQIKVANHRIEDLENALKVVGK